MADTLNEDGTVTLDSDILVTVNKTVIPEELRTRKQQLRASLAQAQANVSRIREAIAQVRAEIAACVAAGAPSDPRDDS